jgi:acyl-coenzyme A synthetase/AMP-(fatty) acid ligase
VYTHGNFAAQVEILKTTYGIEPGEIDLCTFPLFALFGPALGMTCVIPDMNPSRPAEIDPAKAIAQIRQFGVTNAFGSPAVIRRLSTQATDAAGVPQRLATLRRVISAGAPASPRDIEKFAKMLPETAQVFTPYGATEALPVANIGSREILGETRQLTELGKGVCVGKPVAGIEVYAIGITDEAIADWNDSLCVPPGAVGEFAVRGAVVTRRYYNRPDATRLAKIRDAKTGDAIHRMGDVGYLDERGRLWFCGRKSHRVETPTETLFTDTIEPIFNALPGVFRTALVGVIRKGQKHPVLCVELEGGVRPRGSAAEKFERTFAETAEKYPQAQKVRTFLFHRGFPVDVRHNSKIFREKLAVWADRKLGPSWEPPR